MPKSKLDVLILSVRQALLLAVDAIEVYVGMKKTSRFRREEKAKKHRHGEDGHT